MLSMMNINNILIFWMIIWLIIHFIILDVYPNHYVQLRWYNGSEDAVSMTADKDMLDFVYDSLSFYYKDQKYPSGSKWHWTKKMKFSIKNFFRKYDQTVVWSHLLKKPLMENFVFCAMWEKFKVGSNFSIHANASIIFILLLDYHCVKSIQIRSFFWSVFSCIQF